MKAIYVKFFLYVRSYRIKNRKKVVHLSFFIGARVDGFLVSLVIIGGAVVGDAGTCASMIICSSTSVTWLSWSTTPFLWVEYVPWSLGMATLIHYHICYFFFRFYLNDSWLSSLWLKSTSTPWIRSVNYWGSVVCWAERDASIIIETVSTSSLSFRGGGLYSTSSAEGSWFLTWLVSKDNTSKLNKSQTF